MKKDAKGCAFVAHFKIHTTSLDTTSTMAKRKSNIKVDLKHRPRSWKLNARASG